MSKFTRAALSAWAAATVLVAPALANAGGYDTPMLYSARHMGMGGAAIGYVNDPSALFHNPAGLGQIERGEVLGDFSLLLGKIQASPSITAKDVTSDLTVAPFFLVGAAYRVHPQIVLGVGVYPIASAGATFHYGAPGFEDRTELFFLEASPAIAFNVLPNLRIGAGYRLTYVRLVRYEGNPNVSDPPFLDFTLTGQNYTGFRVGAQWSALPWLQFGAVFRNPTTTKVTNDHGTALALEFQDVSTKFKLPAKLGAGGRADFDSFGLPGSVAVDYEYTFNSENQGYPLIGTEPTMPGQPTPAPTSVSNVFDWSDSQTVRVGVEYRLLKDPSGDFEHVAVRAGYVYDSKTANPQYPTPFGTPPGPTQVVTLGTGYNGGNWQTNLAYAYRFGHGAVTKADLNAPGRQECQFCGTAGNQDYAIHLSGLYADVSYKF
jgi:long-subunit fatty acid transport protein